MKNLLDGAVQTNRDILAGERECGPEVGWHDVDVAAGGPAGSTTSLLQRYADRLRTMPLAEPGLGCREMDPAALTEWILGYSVYCGSVGSCVEEVTNWVARGDRTRWLACLNPHSYAVAREKPEFGAALKEADWLIPDGVGVVLASRAFGGQIRNRITGSDVFHAVNMSLNSRGGKRVFFLGSTDGTLRRIREKMAVDYPGVQVVGVYSPPFKPEYSNEEVDEMIAAVNAARPDVLWVGMTAPKQETWIRRVRDRLDVKFAAAIGAVFDFYVGRIQRSSPIFQKAGLEWLPRLMQEPRRLWRRTFVSAPVFLRDVAYHRVLRNRERT